MIGLAPVGANSVKYDVPVCGTINAPNMPDRFVDDDGRIFYKSQNLVYDGINDVDHDKIGLNLSLNNMTTSNALYSGGNATRTFVNYAYSLPNNNVGVLHFYGEVESGGSNCQLDYETINYEWFNGGLPPAGYTRNKVYGITLASDSTASSSCMPVYVEIVNSIVFILTGQKKLYYRPISALWYESFKVVDLSTIITASISSVRLYYKILFINNKYFLYTPTTDTYTGTLLTSTNLTTWTTVTTTPPFSSVQMNLFTFNGKILAFHRRVNDGYYYSSDYGATWSSKQVCVTLVSGSTPVINDIQIVNDKLFVLGGDSGTSANHQVLSYTTDGITWTALTIPNISATVNYTYNFYEAIVYNSNLFIVGRINSVYPIGTAASVSHNGLSVTNYSVFKINLTDMSITNVKINQLSNMKSTSEPYAYSFYGVRKVEGDNIYDYTNDKDTVIKFYKGRLLQIASSNKLSLTIPTYYTIHKFVLNEDTNNFEAAGFGEDLDVCQKINDKFSLSRNRDKILITNTSDYPILSIPDLSLTGQTHLRTK